MERALQTQMRRFLHGFLPCPGRPGRRRRSPRPSPTRPPPGTATTSGCLRGATPRSATTRRFGAIEAYSGAIALRPDSMLAHLRRGETYQRRGDLDAAARDFRTAAVARPHRHRARSRSSATSGISMQRYRRAADAYETRAAPRRPVAPASATSSPSPATATATLDARSSRARTQTFAARRQPGRRRTTCSACVSAISGGPPRRQQAFERAVALSPGLIAAREELADLYGVRPPRRRARPAADHRRPRPRARRAADRRRPGARARAGAPGEPAVLTLGTRARTHADQPPVYGALGRVWLDIAQARDDRDGPQQGARSAGARLLDPARRARRSPCTAARCCATDSSSAPSRRCSAGDDALSRRPGGVSLLRVGGRTAEPSRCRAARPRRLQRARQRRSAIRHAGGANRVAVAAPQRSGQRGKVAGAGGRSRPGRPSSPRLARRSAAQGGRPRRCAVDGRTRPGIDPAHPALRALSRRVN